MINNILSFHKVTGFCVDCGPFEQLTLLQTCFPYDCEEVVEKYLKNPVPLFMKCNLQALYNQLGIGIAAVCRPIVSQTCSIRFNSEEHAGHANQYTVSILIMLCTVQTV